MARVLALIGAVLLCAFFVPLPDSPSAQTWAEGAPDAWSNAQRDLTALQNTGADYICPMDRDVTSRVPGSCPRCGMKLVSGIPDAKEYAVQITTSPAAIEAGRDVQLTFHIEDPAAPSRGKVRDFEIVHEKLYHLFVVSEDLSFFEHVHPELQSDGAFGLKVRLPRPGMYRVLSDFYPRNGTPQLVASTLLVSGDGPAMTAPHIAPELGPQQGANVTVELVNETAQPVAGQKTKMIFRVNPNDGLELYLGAWAHMLAASSDLIDLIHSHPITATDHAGYKQLEFERAFPRGGTYRVWLQLQRKGVVNTVAFNVAVRDPAGD